MAILDSTLEFADAVSVAAGAGTALIGDVIDLSAVQRDIGNGDPMYLVINVDTEVITGDVAANSPELNAGGYPVVVALPLEGVPYERYLGVLATIGSTTVTAGKINAFLTMDPIGWKAYADGSN